MPIKPPARKPLRNTYAAPKPRSKAPSMWKPTSAVTPRSGPATTGFQAPAAIGTPPANSTIYSLPNSAPGYGMAYGADGTPLGSIKLPNAIAAGKGLHYDAQGRLSIVNGTAPAGGPRSIAAPSPLIAPNVGGAMFGPSKPKAAPSPWDSTFFGEMAKNLLGSTNAAGDGVRDQARDDADFAVAQERAKRALAAQLLGADYGANKQGLLYSGHLGKARGDIEQSSADSAADVSTTYGRTKADRTTELDRIGGITAAPGTPLGYTGTGAAFTSFLDSAEASIARVINANPDRAVEFAPYLEAIQAARKPKV